MRFLLFSDLHCSRSAAEKLAIMAKNADILIGAGDFGNIRSGLSQTINILQTLPQPAVLMPGNSESFEELEAACENWPSAHVLHGSGIEIEGIPFWGIGGGVPVTPFGSWSYDFTEAEAEAMLKDCPKNGILISHYPPKGYLDISSSGRSLGSRAVLAAMERCSPQLLVCGHIHESGGKEVKVGSTTVINAGPRGIWWGKK